MSWLVDVLENPTVSPAAGCPPECLEVLDPAACDRAIREIRSWPGYAETPLVSLPGTAREAGVGAIYYKDESTRFGLGSFKALGGSYAVLRYLAKRLRSEGYGDSVSARELQAGSFGDVVSKITVCSATDGNHGRSVAWGARTFGCRCVIYIHENVSEAREAAIAAFGAEVRRVPGNYDDSVARAAADAEAEGWQVISDTSYSGYTRVPRDVMCGYTVMVDEVVKTLAGTPPTHAFVQGGVGGLAATVVARLWWHYGKHRPKVVVVEPEHAACLHASAAAGELVAIEGDLDTLMAGLSAGEPSLLAWPVLRAGAHAFMTIADEAALETMRRLASGDGGDAFVVGGESGVAGLAGLLAFGERPDTARVMGLDNRARVLCFGTEGDTDPDLYTRIVGTSAARVRERNRTR